MTWSKQVIEFILWLKPGNLIQGQILMISLSVRNNTVFPRKDNGGIVLGVRNNIIKEPEILKSEESGF
jgi:hypothetical protein